MLRPDSPLFCAGMTCSYSKGLHLVTIVDDVCAESVCVYFPSTVVINSCGWILSKPLEMDPNLSLVASRSGFD